MALYTLLPLQRFMRERIGWVAVVGCFFTYGCVRQFKPLIKKAGFSKPSTFTWDLQSYATKYKSAMDNVADLSAHRMLMCWDSAFAVTKGITCYALLHMLTDGAEWPAYTVPVHAAMNLLENLLTVIALKRFGSDHSVSSGK